MQAIVTKFLAPTNLKGARIKATAAAGSVTIDFDYYAGEAGSHLLAANALLKKLNWEQNGITIAGSGMLPDGNYCHVLQRKN